MQNLNSVSMRDWIDEGIKVERRQVRVLGLDEHDVRCVVPGQERKARDY